MTDNRDLAKRAKAVFDKSLQLQREGAKLQKADDTYLGQVRDATREYNQVYREVEETSGKAKTEQDMRYSVNALISSFVAGVKLIDIQEQNYQRALGEMGDIESSAKQDMNHLRR